jgi:hypothetical protein
MQAPPPPVAVTTRQRAMAAARGPPPQPPPRQRRQPLRQGRNQEGRGEDDGDNEEESFVLLPAAAPVARVEGATQTITPPTARQNGWILKLQARPALPLLTNTASAAAVAAPHSQQQHHQQSVIISIYITPGMTSDVLSACIAQAVQQQQHSYLHRQNSPALLPPLGAVAGLFIAGLPFSHSNISCPWMEKIIVNASRCHQWSMICWTSITLGRSWYGSFIWRERQQLAGLLAAVEDT